MAIVKGTGVIFELKDGADIKAPASYGLFHDSSGKEWPKNSGLVGPFERGPRVDDVPGEVRAYLGRGHHVHQGEARIERLPRNLSAWNYEGEIAIIFYRRGGTRAPGNFRHRINKASLARFLFGKGRATLYSRSDWYRMELSRGSWWDDRGIVWP